MPFSAAYRQRLETCDPRLQRVMNAVEPLWECAILAGHRDQAEQDADFAAGKTELKWPNGKHNAEPSLAVDAAPSPVDWENRERFIYFAGFVIGIAAGMGIKLRWGGDWKGLRDPKQNKFSDLDHFEIVE